MTDRFEKRETFLPYSLPTIGEEEIAEVADSLRSGWVTTGPKVSQFEGSFAGYAGASHAVAVSSCTAGLHLALAALGIGPGDEVILPTFTFCSTANVVVHLGARPVLVDVGGDCNLTLAEVEEAVTPRTRAIIPVHYGGQACELAPLYAFAGTREIPVVEDAAHAAGSSYRDQKVGSDTLAAPYPGLTRVVVFSFYATKNLTTGEGGMVVTSDADLAEKVRLLSLHGMSHDAWKRYTSAGSWYYEVVAAGYKYNMTDIQAAIGIHQLSKLDGFIKRRRQIASRYDRALAELDGIDTLLNHPDRENVYHLYPVLLDADRFTIDRDQWIIQLKERNVGTSVHFIPVHLHPFYQQTYGYQVGDFLAAEGIYQRIVSLPIYPRMSDGDQEYVISAIMDIANIYS
jgi:dTDP-4-amino-4,6-dideoxygalactose transaminase